MITHLKLKLLFAVAIMNLNSLPFFYAAPILTSPIGLQTYTNKFLDNQEVDIAELSGLAYNTDFNVLIGISDEGEILELTNKKRKLNSEFSNNNCSNPNSLPTATSFNDTEAIVHISGHTYAIMEEREARVSLVTIDFNTSTVNFPMNSTYSLTSGNTIPSCDNDGLEGLAYDKTNANYYTIKQASNPQLYTFKASGNSATVAMTSVTNLTNIIPPSTGLTIESVHGLHFDDNSKNLLIIGTIGNGNNNHGDNERVLIELTPTGTYVSHLHLEDDLSTQFSAGSSYNIEGITMINSLIMLIGEIPSSSNSKMYGLSKAGFTTPISLNVNVFLEGCFDNISGTMKTDLLDREVLPGLSNNNTFSGQPYNYAPFNYAGTEGVNWVAYQNNVVDWVIVSFREEAQQNQFLSIAGILQSNGQITFPYPNPKILDYSDFPSTNEFYITIQHRNHLMVMSNSARIRLHNMSIEWDFTVADSYTNNQSGTGQIMVGSHYCMAAGNIDQAIDIVIGSIDANDYSIWRDNNGPFNVYSDSDINMNADVNGGDRILWEENNGLFNYITKL